MGYFPVWYDSRVVIYERKMFIRLATGSGKTRWVQGVQDRLTVVGSNPLYDSFFK